MKNKPRKNTTNTKGFKYYIGQYVPPLVALFEIDNSYFIMNRKMVWGKPYYKLQGDDNKTKWVKEGALDKMNNRAIDKSDCIPACSNDGCEIIEEMLSKEPISNNRIDELESLITAIDKEIEIITQALKDIIIEKEHVKGKYLYELAVINEDKEEADAYVLDIIE